MSLKEIMTFDSEPSIAFVESVLMSEGIRYFIAGESYESNMSRLLVHEADVEQARSILIDVGLESRVYSLARIKKQ